MSYSIFLSHATEDAAIAKTIKEKLNKIFPELSIYLATDEIRSGTKWKDELKQNLQEHNAIITLISQISIDKPWIYTEWSPFWMAEKPFHLLLLDDKLKKDLIGPMKDCRPFRRLR